MPPETPFDLKFTSREATAWGGLALLKRMLEGMGFKEAVQSWDLPQPGSNRGYRPEQLIEQMIVSIWCAAARFAHADITRLDATLVRLFDWGHAAGHKAIVRLFQRFNQPSANRGPTQSQEDQPHHQRTPDPHATAGHRRSVQMAADRGRLGSLGTHLPTPRLAGATAPGGGAPAHQTQEWGGGGQDAIAVCR
jgi:hypothetical protein